MSQMDEKDKEILTLTVKRITAAVRSEFQKELGGAVNEIRLDQKDIRSEIERGFGNVRREIDSVKHTADHAFERTNTLFENEKSSHEKIDARIEAHSKHLDEMAGAIKMYSGLCVGATVLITVLSFAYMVVKDAGAQQPPPQATTSGP